jgi:hypothetical protein
MPCAVPSSLSDPTKTPKLGVRETGSSSDCVEDLKKFCASYRLSLQLGPLEGGVYDGRAEFAIMYQESPAAGISPIIKLSLRRLLFREYELGGSALLETQELREKLLHF